MMYKLRYTFEGREVDDCDVNFDIICEEVANDERT